ncbi:MAG: sulfatase-like hydrolase/transferase [Coriobacteriales bacterium]|jgi:hypothetical protein|nr:sulfatase-like hydrolase/transferase [Coriobacteriales bacterium]
MKASHRFERPVRLGLLLLIWTIVLFFIHRPAWAYIDPATTTYVVQIFTAVIVALGVTLSILVYRAQSALMAVRMFFYRLYVRVIKRQKGVLGDTEVKRGLNRRKVARAAATPKPRYQYPANVLPGEPIGSSARRRIRKQARVAQSAAYEGGRGSWQNLWRDDRRLRSRLLIAALLSASLSLTLLVFTMCDLLAANSDSLSYLLPGIIIPILLVGLVAGVLFTGVLLIFRGRLFDLITALLLAVLLAAYLQGNFLNPDLGALTGDAIPWHALRGQTALNLLFWIGLIVAVLAVRYFSTRLFKIVILALPALLIVVQLAALAAIVPELNPSIAAGSERTRYREVLTTKGLTEVSPQDNILIFLLDRFDEEYVSEILAQDPNFFEPLDGFTHFNNNITHYRWTFPSVIEILTGNKLLTTGKAEEFAKLAYRKSTFLPQLKAADYELKLYSDDIAYFDTELIKPFFSNLQPLEQELDIPHVLLRLGLLSAYRQAPIALKPMLWISTSDLVGLYQFSKGSHEVYVFDDVKFMKTIRSRPLKADMPKKNFAFYHLMGPHTPLYMDEHAEYSSAGSSSVIRQGMGSFRAVFEYLRQLRELGLYDQATIIITADHGYSGSPAAAGGGLPWNVDPDPSVATLFVKPAGSFGAPMQLNSAPVTTENLRATVIAAAGLDHAAYGPSYFEVPQDAALIRRFYWLVDAGDSAHYHYQVLDVKGDAKRAENWHHVEDIFPDGTLKYTN